jgi:hypothetical protein
MEVRKLNRKLYLPLAIFLALALLFALGCKKKEEKEGGKGKYFEDYAGVMDNFKVVYKAACLDQDVSGVKEEAKNAHDSWLRLADNYKDAPPAKYAEDKNWVEWLGKMGDGFQAIDEQTQTGNVSAVEGACRNVQELIFDLDERTNNLSAIDELSQFTLLIYRMEKALNEGNGDEAKRNFRMLKESQDRLYTSPYPDSAKGRTEEFDQSKNKVYDLLNEFELADKEKRPEKLAALKQKAEEFYLEFGF